MKEPKKFGFALGQSIAIALILAVLAIAAALFWRLLRWIIGF